MDIGDKKSIAAFAEWMKKTYGGFDILCNNAAMAFKGSDPTPFAKQAEPTMKINYYGTLEVCDQLVPLLRKGGTVVNVASQAGSGAYKRMSKELQASFSDPALDRSKLCKLVDKFCADVKSGKHQEAGWPNTCYGTSKAAVIFLSRLLADGLKGDGITCNSMCPGYCRTDMSSHNGNRSAAEGADTAIWLCLQTNNERPNGGFFFDRKVINL
mmetsp:Transcript_24217/g.47442  ORF Transcript_24217/g.47442 Transcript_24217/m.47442 type:complete len:212 (-) Transcript_24217:142-777(-)